MKLEIEVDNVRSGSFNIYFIRFIFTLFYIYININVLRFFIFRIKIETIVLTA